MEFEQQTESITTAEERMRTWLASIHSSDTTVFQTVLEVAWSAVPQESRIQFASTFPEDISRQERGIRWSECVLGYLVLFAEQIENEITYLEEGINEINRELVTTDADLAAIMPTPELGDL